MTEDVPDDQTSGRLRAEDRRGKIGNQFQESQELDHTPEDPEENWEQRKGGRRGRQAMGIFAAIVFLFAAGFLAFSLFSGDKDKPVNRQGNNKPEPPKSFLEKSTTAEIDQAITACVKGFMNASSHQERCRFLIGGDTLEPSLALLYSRPDTDPPQSFGNIHTKQQGAFQGVPMYAVFATEAHRNSGVFLNLLPTQSGMAIDWESSVGYGDLSWTDFSESKPSSPTLMRVYLEMIPFDPEEPDNDLRAYCEISVRGSSLKHLASFPRNSEVASKLTTFATPGAIQPLCLKLRWISNGASVEISEIVHNYWINTQRYQQFLRSPSVQSSQEKYDHNEMNSD